jgi:hypothetical protein
MHIYMETDSYKSKLEIEMQPLLLKVITYQLEERCGLKTALKCVFPSFASNSDLTDIYRLRVVTCWVSQPFNKYLQNIYWCQEQYQHWGYSIPRIDTIVHFFQNLHLIIIIIIIWTNLWLSSVINGTRWSLRVHRWLTLNTRRLSWKEKIFHVRAKKRHTDVEKLE